MLNHLICFFLIRKLNMKQEIWNFSLFKPTRVLFFTVVSFHEHFNFRRSLIAQMITFWQWCQRGVMCLLIFWHIFASDRCIFSQPAQIVKERQKNTFLISLMLHVWWNVMRNCHVTFDWLFLDWIWPELIRLIASDSLPDRWRTVQKQD